MLTRTASLKLGIPSLTRAAEGSTVVRSADFFTLPFCPAEQRPARQSEKRNQRRDFPDSSAALNGTGLWVKTNLVCGVGSQRTAPSELGNREEETYGAKHAFVL